MCLITQFELMGLNCFACFVALFAALCFLLCYLIVPLTLTIGYWLLLYKTAWAHGVAIISIIFFGLTLIFHLASVIIGAIVLCATGTAAVLAMPAIGIPGSLAMIAVVVIIVMVLTFFFGVAVLGLLTSITLLNSGAQQCPTGGADCQLLVILFAICVFSNSLRVLRKTPKKDPIDELITVDAQITPENSSATMVDKSKILVTTFLFDPLAHASRPTPTFLDTVPNERDRIIV